MGMNAYFSTFIAGFGEVIKAALPRQMPDTKIDLLSDGLVAYRTATSALKIEKLGFFNNSFALLEKFEKRETANIDLMMNRLLQRFDFEKIPKPLLGRRKSFRVRFVRESETIAVDKVKRQKLEQRISQFTGLRVNPAKPDIEFWLISRRDGHGFFGLRLTRHTAYEKVLHKGELRPQLAHLLCLISEPAGDEVVLDPFCGWGAIPLERAKSFPYRRILAGDQEAGLVQQASLKGKRFKNLTFQQWNAFKLSNIKEATIDKVITDPPWGIFGGAKLPDMEGFYTKMLAELQRVLKPGGLAVILTGAKVQFEAALAQHQSFALLERCDVLVS